MNNNLEPDFKLIIKKIFKLTANLRKLRQGFSFSKNDLRAEKDKKFIQKWIEIKNNQ